MRLTDVDSELARLTEASERIAANLVELEIDSSRQLLEASVLTGVSATRWAAGSAALSDLWAWRSLLEDLLERAEKLHGSRRRADELRPLLEGASIELTRAPVPLAERKLLDSAEMTTRCTPGELLTHMSSAFDEAKTVVAEFGAAWNALSPRVAGARAALEQARKLAASLGESDRRELLQAKRQIEQLTATVSTDPLSIPPGRIDALIASIEAIGRELEAAAALRGSLDGRLADARARLASLTTLIREARAAHEEATAKIAVPAAPPPPELPDESRAELDQIEQIAASGGWSEAGRRLERWTARTSALRDETQRILRANRAPLEARRQLRGLLEAYQVKAGRVGAIENPELERIYAQAHDELYTAPTDLARVAQLVRRYQEIVSGTGPAREAAR